MSTRILVQVMVSIFVFFFLMSALNKADWESTTMEDALRGNHGSEQQLSAAYQFVGPESSKRGNFLRAANPAPSQFVFELQ